MLSKILVTQKCNRNLQLSRTTTTFP